MIVSQPASRHPPSGASRLHEPSAASRRPAEPLPVEEPAPGTAHPTPPIGGWWCHDPRPGRLGWHVACPCCLDGRGLLAPDPADPFGYVLRERTCTAGCTARDVMRAFAWREGDMGLFFRWLERQRPARRAAA